MEVRHSLWSLRCGQCHASCHFLQHSKVSSAPLWNKCYKVYKEESSMSLFVIKHNPCHWTLIVFPSFSPRSFFSEEFWSNPSFCWRPFVSILVINRLSEQYSLKLSLRRVEQLTEQMTKKKFTVSCLHGDMEQSERDVIMREFRSGSSRVLITTDLLARGIDVQQVGESISSSPKKQTLKEAEFFLAQNQLLSGKYPFKKSAGIVVSMDNSVVTKGK